MSPGSVGPRRVGLEAEAQVATLRSTTGSASPLRAHMVTQLNDLGILAGFENLIIVSLSDPEQAESADLIGLRAAGECEVQLG